MKKLMISKKWFPSLFSTGWVMTRITNGKIEVKPITLIDKIFHWYHIYMNTPIYPPVKK